MTYSTSETPTFHGQLSTCQAPGEYLFEGEEGIQCAQGGEGDIEYYLPHEIKWAFGPLPSSREDALDIATKIAFAEMWLAGMEDIKAKQRAFTICETRFTNGERSPELLAEMKRVTRELTK